jgi:hypothetical protein
MPTSSIFNGTGPKEIGADTNGTANNFNGKVRYAKTIVNGDTLFNLDARSVPLTTRNIQDPARNIFELVGTANIIVDGTGPEYVARKAMARTANVLNYDNDGSEQPITGIFVIGQGEGVDKG